MQDEHELLAAWQSGDEVAGEALFERYYEGLAFFFASKAGEDARDLIQRTFLLLLENQGRVRDSGNLHCYLYGIARNVLYQYYRGKRRNRDRFVPEEESFEDLVPSASALIGQAEEAQLLLQALRRIPLESQVILELYFWEQMTAKEIGDVLEVPEGTARTRIRRAKQLLEKQLELLANSPHLLESTLSDLDGWAKKLRAAWTPPQ
ncbi:RNA polymerase sigma factor [Nannocystis exedens]|uniref:RNA polymerase sigma factor n=1 Tax=Nannocystis exedens TaxID=54 RepID=UPI001FECCE8E|nr:sigma-70 family RNA polymerase sigma factor [Nannocystis exedens]